MGDSRFGHAFDAVVHAADRVTHIRRLSDDALIAALAGASRSGDPLLANVLATEALNRAARTQRILASMGDAVIAFDLPDFQVSLVNRNAERLIGAPASALLGLGADALFDAPDGGAGVREAMERAFRGTTVLWGSWALRRADGSIVEAEHAITAVTNAEGEGFGVVDIVRLADAEARRATPEARASRPARRRVR